MTDAPVHLPVFLARKVCLIVPGGKQIRSLRDRRYDRFNAAIGSIR